MKDELFFVEYTVNCIVTIRNSFEIVVEINNNNFITQKKDIINSNSYGLQQKIYVFYDEYMSNRRSEIIKKVIDKAINEKMYKDFIKTFTENQDPSNIVISTSIVDIKYKFGRKENMTRDEMIKLISEHPYLKVTHWLFSSDEFLYTKPNGNVYDENDYLFEDWYSEGIYRHDGLRQRINGNWETGWEVYNE